MSKPTTVTTMPSVTAAPFGDPAPIQTPPSNDPLPPRPAMGTREYSRVHIPHFAHNLYRQHEVVTLREGDTHHEVVPTSDVANWKLRIHGDLHGVMVRRGSVGGYTCIDPQDLAKPAATKEAERRTVRVPISRPRHPVISPNEPLSLHFELLLCDCEECVACQGERAVLVALDGMGNSYAYVY